MPSAFQRLATCAFLLLLCVLSNVAPLTLSQTVQRIVDDAARNNSGRISLPSRTFMGRTDASNCNVQVNSSHATNGSVTISGASDDSTIIDCSGTGMRCFSVTGVSVTIRRVRFIGNRALFPRPSAPAPPASNPSSHDNIPQHHTARGALVTPNFHRASVPSQPDHASDDIVSGIIRSRLAHLENLFDSATARLPLQRSFANANRAARGEFLPPTKSGVSFADAANRASEPPVPLAGGCILIHHAPTAIIEDSSFLNCASSAVGGSVAIIHSITVLISRSIFSDSLVNVVNSSFLEQPVDRTFLRERLAGITGIQKLPGGLGYGGAVFIVPAPPHPSLMSPSVSISIVTSTFVRCQVLAASDHFDFMSPSSISGNFSGMFLQGGAVAVFPLLVNMSHDGSGYLLAMTSSTFTQCSVFCTSNGVPGAGYDALIGGAVSVFESPAIPDLAGFVFPPSRVILQDVAFSGNFVCRLQKKSIVAPVAALEMYGIGGSLFIVATADVSMTNVHDRSSFSNIEVALDAVKYASLRVESRSFFISAIAGSTYVSSRFSTTLMNVSIVACSSTVKYDGSSAEGIDLAISAIGGGAALLSNSNPFFSSENRRFFKRPSRISIHTATFSKNRAAIIRNLAFTTSNNSRATALGGSLAILHSDVFGVPQLRENLDQVISVFASTFSNNTVGAVFPIQTYEPSSPFVISAVVLGGSMFVDSSATQDGNSLSLDITNSEFSNSFVVLDQSFFTRSFATLTNGYSGGGALFVRSFIVNIHNSSFIANAAITTPFRVRNSIFSNGGAVLFSQHARSSGMLRNVSRSSFARNVASGAGSAVFAESGTILSMSHSSLTSNHALGATLVSSGEVSIVSSTFCNNTAGFLVTDVLVTCVSPLCGANISASTFTSLEAGDFIAHAQGSLISAGHNMELDSCRLSLFFIVGNGYAPYFNSANTKFFDRRNSKQACTSKTSNDLSIAILDRSNGLPAADVDFSCSMGQYPHFTLALSATLSRVTLKESSTRIFQYPAYADSTPIHTYDTLHFMCRTCPPDTFQGLQPLPYSLRLGGPTQAATNHTQFCKPCPRGAYCSDVASMKVSPGLYLWSISNPSSLNVSAYAQRLPSGYGSSEPSHWLSPCLRGSNRLGVLCGQCNSGYSAALFTTFCVENSKCNDGPWFFVVVTLLGLALSFCLLVSSSRPDVTFFDGAIQVMSLYFQLLGLIMEPYHSDFLRAFSEFTASMRTVFNLQPYSSENSGGVCLYSSMTTKEVFAIKFAIYGIIYADFVFLAILWPMIQAPILKRIQSWAAKATQIANRLAAAAEMWFKQKFERTRETRESDADASSINGALQMDVIQETYLKQGDESKPTSILVFADSMNITSTSNEAAQNSQAVHDVVSDTRGAAGLQLFLLTFIGPVEICLQMLTCYSLPGVTIGDKLASSSRWWYDGSEECFAMWQLPPLFSLIFFAFLPVLMTLRAMWLKRRFWAGGATGPSSRGWFWEASYFEFYRSSFRDEFPHWLPVQLALRILVLMMTIIERPYWRLFSINTVVFAYLIVELIVKPWRLRSVQLFSYVSFFLLLYANSIFFRPASFQAALVNPNDADDGFLSPHFVGFVFIGVLVVFPVGLSFLFFVRRKLIDG